jgi:hypothetical protein
MSLSLIRICMRGSEAAMISQPLPVVAAPLASDGTGVGSPAMVAVEMPVDSG